MIRNRIVWIRAAAWLAIALGSSMEARASFVVVPNGFAASNGNSGNNALLQTSGRTVQTVYDASQFASIPHGEYLNSIAFRVDNGTSGTWPPADLNFANYDVEISTSLHGVGSLDNTFANNIAADAVHVRTGPLTVEAGSLTGGAGPNPFGFVIPFTTPFRYVGGDILVTIRHTGSGASSAPQFLDSILNGTSAFGQVIASPGSNATSNGGSSASFVVAQFGHAAPEPATVFQAFAGLVLAMGAARFRRG